nr:MAG TPA: hypothetical protein [Crassvirales sp.]
MLSYFNYRPRLPINVFTFGGSNLDGNRIVYSV